MSMSNELQLYGMYATVILIGLVMMVYAKIDEKRKSAPKNKA